MWMTGNAMRLLERVATACCRRPLACHRYANGLAAGAAVRCPALAILAARDVMAPLRNAQALIAALADVRPVTLAETGHSMMAERPGEVLDALRTFLLIGRRAARHLIEQPIDGMLLDRRAAGARDLRHRVVELALRRWVGRAARRVEPAAVGERQVAVEAEEVGRAHGIVGARDVLRFVDDIRKREVRASRRTSSCCRTNPPGRPWHRCS